MANLSNINNKFLVTTGGNVLIGQTAAVGSSIFQVTGAANIKGTANFAPVLTLGTAGAINAVINSADEMFFNIDSDNNQSSASFHFGHNSTTGNGSTKLMTIKDNGTVAFGPDAQDIQIIPSSTGGGLNKVYLRGNAVGDKAEISLNHYGYANLFIGVGTTANTVMSLTATSGGTDGIIIDTSGNVGIGTAGPEGKLNVETNAESNVPALGANTTFLKISNTGGAYGAMIGQLGSGNSYIQSQRFDGTATAYNLLLQPNGGNVGIGTVSPASKFEVYGGSSGVNDVDRYMRFKASNGEKRFDFYVGGTGNASSLGMYTSDGTTKQVQISSGGTSYLNGGNVGIGTDSPNNFTNQTSLTVSGTSIGRVDVQVTAGGGGGIYGSSSQMKMFSNYGMNLALESGTGGVTTFTTDGSERMRINAAGTIQMTDENGGVPTLQVRNFSTSATGAFTDAYAMEFRGATTTGATGGMMLLHMNEADDARPTLNVSDSNGIFATFTNGKVGIGTTSPGQKLEVAGRIRVTTDPTIEFYESSVKRGGIQWSLANDNTNIFAVGGNITFDIGGEKMRIKANGQIDFASPGTPNQSGISMFGGSSGGIMYMYRPVGQNGDIIRFQTAISSTSSTRVGYINTTGSATTYNSASDYRLKENVVKITGALDRVSKLKPSRFNFIIEPENTVDGFIAHEVQEVVPEAVTGYKDEVDENGENHYQGMDNSRLVPLLAAAIQELKAEIEILKSK